jgi:hypothetical protein
MNATEWARWNTDRNLTQQEILTLIGDFAALETKAQGWKIGLENALEHGAHAWHDLMQRIPVVEKIETSPPTLVASVGTMEYHFEAMSKQVKRTHDAIGDAFPED